MKKKSESPQIINSVSELHRLLGLSGPEHPLVSVIDLSEARNISETSKHAAVFNFYSVCIKKDFKGKLKHGQNYYDFDEGVMTFFSPGQVISAIIEEDLALSGWWLVVHPDFVRNYSLAKTIRNYGFFSYAANEALHLSEKEEQMIVSIIENIRREYRAAIDAFSQNVIVAQIDLLLNYCDRFYNRQFITRKTASSDLLIRLEELLTDYFDHNRCKKEGLPTVHFVSEQLHISPNYLSDMLRTLTGQSTQQHIQNKLIEKAKFLLTTTPLAVSEIAYLFGFEHPQSFTKLFKNKTNMSPRQFKQSMN